MRSPLRSHDEEGRGEEGGRGHALVSFHASFCVGKLQWRFAIPFDSALQPQVQNEPRMTLSRGTVLSAPVAPRVKFGRPSLLVTHVLSRERVFPTFTFRLVASPAPLPLSLPSFLIFVHVWYTYKMSASFERSSIHGHTFDGNCDKQSYSLLLAIDGKHNIDF